MPAVVPVAAVAAALLRVPAVAALVTLVERRGHDVALSLSLDDVGFGSEVGRGSVVEAGRAGVGAVHSATKPSALAEASAPTAAASEPSKRVVLAEGAAGSEAGSDTGSRWEGRGRSAGSASEVVRRRAKPEALVLAAEWSILAPKAERSSLGPEQVVVAPVVVPPSLAFALAPVLLTVA